MKDPDVYAWDLLSMILGSGETSRLYRSVKDGKGLVDSVSASSYTPRDPGLLFVGGTLSPEKAREALKEILLETFRMVAAPPEGAEPRGPRRPRRRISCTPLESQSALARHVGFYETTLNDAAFEQTYLRKIRAVTADDIRTVAKKYLSPGNLTVSAVLPAGKGDSSRGRGPCHRAAGVRGGDRTGREDRKKRTVVKGVLGNGIRVIVRENRAVRWWRCRRGFSRGCGRAEGERRRLRPHRGDARQGNGAPDGAGNLRGGGEHGGRTSPATRGATRSACRGSSSSATSKKAFACSPNRCSSRRCPPRSSRRSGSRRSAP